MTTSLQRLLATFVAVLPLLAGTDPCTVGALTGQPSLSCISSAEAVMACHVEVNAPRAHSCCAPEAPDRDAPPLRGQTCCDLKPLAPGTAEQPTLAAPGLIAHTVPVVGAALLAPAPAWHRQSAPAADESPPRDLPAPLSPRAPPLS